jgi:hypothetical protein
MYGPNDVLHSDKGCMSVIIAFIVVTVGLFAIC